MKTWEELPPNARKYVEFVEGFTGVRVGWVGTGPGRGDMVVR